MSDLHEKSGMMLLPSVAPAQSCEIVSSDTSSMMPMPIEPIPPPASNTTQAFSKRTSQSRRPSSTESIVEEGFVMEQVLEFESGEVNSKQRKKGGK